MNAAANHIKSLKTQLTHKNIDPAEYAEKSNTILVSAIQHAAEKVLSRTNFRGKLGHREKFLSLLHAGPASIRVVASNSIESVAHHVFQLQALGYSIETTCGANGVVMFELAKEPVTYVENDADDCAYWGQCV